MFVLIQTTEMILVMLNNLQKLSKVSYKEVKRRDRSKELDQKKSERMLFTNLHSTCILALILIMHLQILV